MLLDCVPLTDVSFDVLLDDVLLGGVLLDDVSFDVDGEASDELPPLGDSTAGDFTSPPIAEFVPDSDVEVVGAVAVEAGELDLSALDDCEVESV